MSILNLPEIDFDRLFDLEVNEAIRRAKADPEEAAHVLLLAVKCLRQHKPLPYLLADYLADAFESAMLKPMKVRLSELGFELNLKSRNKRPHALDVPAAYAIIQKNYHLVDQGSGRSNFKTPALRELLIKKGKCSDSVARRLLDKIDRIHQEEDELICKRQS